MVNLTRRKMRHAAMPCTVYYLWTCTSMLSSGGMYVATWSTPVSWETFVCELNTCSIPRSCKSLTFQGCNGSLGHNHELLCLCSLFCFSHHLLFSLPPFHRVSIVSQFQLLAMSW